MKPATKKRSPFRRPQVSQTDQIMRDRNKFEKANASIAAYIVEHPEKVEHNPAIMEWAAIVLNPPLEDDGSELVVKG